MNSVRTGTFRSFLLVAIASWVVDGHAWAQTMPSPVMPPATTVGLPDLAVRESRERVRTSIGKVVS